MQELTGRLVMPARLPAPAGIVPGLSAAVTGAASSTVGVITDRVLVEVDQVCGRVAGAVRDRLVGVSGAIWREFPRSPCPSVGPTAPGRSVPPSSNVSPPPSARLPAVPGGGAVPGSTRPAAAAMLGSSGPSWPSVGRPEPERAPDPAELTDTPGGDPPAPGVPVPRDDADHVGSRGESGPGPAIGGTSGQGFQDRTRPAVGVRAGIVVGRTPATTTRPG